MGASSACKTFERFSDALKFALAAWYRVSRVIKVLDDFLFLGDSYDECARALDSFVTLCAGIGVPLAEDKTVGPVQELVFLGIQLNSRTMIASIPADKLSRYRGNLQDALANHRVPLRALKSAIGKLQFRCLIIPAGRCSLRRPHDATRGPPIPDRLVSLSAGCRAVLEMWAEFLAAHNGKETIATRPSVCASTLNRCSVSSLTGFGATFGRHYLMGRFNERWVAYGIQVLELYPIFLVLSKFAKESRHHRVVVRCDNTCVVAALNSLTSRNQVLMRLLRRLVLVLLHHNISVHAVHVPGRDNQLWVALSRQIVPSDLLRQRGFLPDPWPVAPHLDPAYFRL